jgi:hypothetical protein
VVLDPAGITIADHERGQSAPSCAASGDTFWVAFHTNTCDSTYSNVYAARITGSGSVLDPDGFPVCTAEGEQRNVKLASGDGTLLVMWEEDRNFGSTGYDVYAARISSDGTVLDPDGMAVSELSHSELTPDVGWTGQAFLGIWQAGASGEEWNISGARIDALGEILDSTSIVVSTGCAAQISAGCAFSGSNYLASWEEEGDIYGARVSRSGDVLDSSAFLICAAQETQDGPAVAWDGENFLAVWEDFRNQNLDIYGARIDSLGQLLDSLGLPIRVDPGQDQRRPSIGFDGENYLVVWQTDLDSVGLNYRIEGLRVSSQGEALDPEPFLISTGQYGSYPDVAFAGGKYLVVWLDAYYFDIYGTFVETNGAIGSQVGIRTASGLQQNPKVASNGSEFLVVWEDFGMHWPNSDILATRVTPGGSVLDPGGIMVATTEDPEEHPSVTFNGYNFAVAWKRLPGQTAELYAAGVSSEGTVLDPGGILISDVSLYSGTSISFGPVGPSLMLYSKHQAEPFNSPRMYGALFWGGPEPNLPPEPFSLILPADQDTVAEPVSFDWEDAYDPNSADQVTYTLFVSSSDHFPAESTLVVDSLISSQGIASPQQDGLNYWWKVKAQDPWGETSWSTQVFSFRLESYGDVTGDGAINIGDVVFLINFLYRGGPPPQPLSSGDINTDCEVNVGDVVYLINYLFRGGPRPREGCA